MSEFKKFNPVVDDVDDNNNDRMSDSTVPEEQKDDAKLARLIEKGSDVDKIIATMNEDELKSHADQIMKALESGSLRQEQKVVTGFFSEEDAIVKKLIQNGIVNLTDKKYWDVLKKCREGTEAIFKTLDPSDQQHVAWVKKNILSRLHTSYDNYGGFIDKAATFAGLVWEEDEVVEVKDDRGEVINKKIIPRYKEMTAKEV